MRYRDESFQCAHGPVHRNGNMTAEFTETESQGADKRRGSLGRNLVAIGKVATVPSTGLSIRPSEGWFVRIASVQAFT